MRRHFELFLGLYENGIWVPFTDLKYRWHFCGLFGRFWGGNFNVLGGAGISEFLDFAVCRLTQVFQVGWEGTLLTDLIFYRYSHIICFVIVIRVRNILLGNFLLWYFCRHRLIDHLCLVQLSLGSYKSTLGNNRPLLLGWTRVIIFALLISLFIRLIIEFIPNTVKDICEKLGDFHRCPFSQIYLFCGLSWNVDRADHLEVLDLVRFRVFSRDQCEVDRLLLLGISIEPHNWD